MTGPENLKSTCFKCGHKKWNVDFKEGCAARISSTSTCLSCEQAIKIEKLEKAIKERDNEVKRMKETISKLESRDNEEKRMKEMIDKLESRVKELEKTREEKCINGVVKCTSGGDSSIMTECCEAQKLQEKVEEISKIARENIDNIIESGRAIVEIRQDIAAMKDEMEFKKVKGRKAGRRVEEKGKKCIPLVNRFAVLSQEEETCVIGDSLVREQKVEEKGEKCIPLVNRYAVLSQEEETWVIGDSLVREQEEYFANRNKRKRKVKSFPGCKTKKVVEEVRKLELQSRNSCIITHVGTNDLFLRGNKVGNSEPLVKDLESLVDSIAEKTCNGIVTGMLPRTYVSHYALSKAVGVNERTKKYCSQKGVEFLDLWDEFVGKREFFKRDGIHLSEAGQRKLGAILGKKCENLVKQEKSKAEVSTEVQLPNQETSNGNLDYSFTGFPQGN